MIDFFGGDGRNRTEKGRVVDFFLGAMDEIGLKKNHTDGPIGL